MAARIAPFLVVLVSALAAAAPASAAPPVNDAFAAAELLTGTSATATSVSNAQATKETGEPNHAGTTGGGSVWYRWVAPSDGVAIVSTAGSSFDTVLAAYTGAT